MNVRYHGHRPYDFEDEKTKKPITGTSIYVSHADPTDPDLIGEKTDKLSVPKGFKIPACNTHDIIDVEFNRRGKVVGIKVVQAAK